LRTTLDAIEEDHRIADAGVEGVRIKHWGTHLTDEKMRQTTFMDKSVQQILREAARPDTCYGRMLKVTLTRMTPKPHEDLGPGLPPLSRNELRVLLNLMVTTPSAVREIHDISRLEKYNPEPEVRTNSAPELEDGSTILQLQTETCTELVEKPPAPAPQNYRFTFVCGSARDAYYISQRISEYYWISDDVGFLISVEQCLSPEEMQLRLEDGSLANPSAMEVCPSAEGREHLLPAREQCPGSG